jgi:hypothetical protein
MAVIAITADHDGFAWPEALALSGLSRVFPPIMAR